MKLDTIVAIVISALVLYAAFRYEREDLGCESCWSTSVAACSDYNSIYVRGTKYQKNDDSNTLKKKLKKLLSFDEAAGSWKRCVLWSFLLTVLGYAIYAKGGCIDGSNINKNWLFVISWIVNFSVLYALKSFESSHIFRVIKNNGMELCEKL
ncbi:hypothetical protein PBCVNEJV1_135L [Paramecium bursaria Chlorella virus NE-JV-1]|nr:hypothetical protein PBCVNEJV1_135L [Paramecium bursaria Chlorella virus NE-JV-1]